MAAATLDELVEAGRRYGDWFLRSGTTTVEAKSGYGLTTAEELRALRIIARVAARAPVNVVPTFLGAHVVPEEFRGNYPESGQRRTYGRFGSGESMQQGDQSQEVQRLRRRLEQLERRIRELERDRQADRAPERARAADLRRSAPEHGLRLESDPDALTKVHPSTRSPRSLASIASASKDALIRSERQA